MFAKSILRRLGAVLALVALAFAVASCQRAGGNAGAPDMSRIFGNGFQDASEVIAKVGDIEITSNDFDRRYAELPDRLKRQYSGDGWQKRFIRFMIDEALMYREAVKRNLARDPEVAQALISDHRYILVNAFRERSLVKDLQPTEQQIRTYFERNRSSYMLQGTLQARHIQLRDRKTAFQVYDELRQSGNIPWHFPRMVAKYSVNTESAKQAGDLGWFNRGGFIPALVYGKLFSETVWDWPIGLHEPVEMGGDWHVVDIVRREHERPLSLEEARDQVVEALTPMLKQDKLDEFLREQHQATPIEYFGAYKPGGGMSPRDLIRLGQMAQTPEQQIEIYRQVVEDYGDSDYVDDAYFLLANVYFDTWGEIPFASKYLDLLLTDYPDSEYADQASYMLKNMGKPSFRNPTSVEDLRGGNP